MTWYGAGSRRFAMGQELSQVVKGHPSQQGQRQAAAGQPRESVAEQHLSGIGYSVVDF